MLLRESKKQCVWAGMLLRRSYNKCVWAGSYLGSHTSNVSGQGCYLTYDTRNVSGYCPQTPAGQKTDETASYKPKKTIAIVSWGPLNWIYPRSLTQFDLQGTESKDSKNFRSDIEKKDTPPTTISTALELYLSVLTVTQRKTP